MEFQSSSFRRLGLGVFWIWTKRQEHNSAWQNMLLFLSSKIHFIFYQEIWSFAVKLLQSLLLVRFPVLICVGNIINLTRFSSVCFFLATQIFFTLGCRCLLVMDLIAVSFLNPFTKGDLCNCECGAHVKVLQSSQLFLLWKYEVEMKQEKKAAKQVWQQFILSWIAPLLCLLLSSGVCFTQHLQQRIECYMAV